ncbi:MULTISPECIES: BLUF domain-containing protein [unclassified Aureimonas]|uniref:BLUF domain-containing protein n=1 Tax=unclassified Aureimonas TaxID=2615206 RepID=UPI0006FFDAA7|nr:MULTISPECIES: BLUF domain-containing protein [unclassified Aureimonas]KQT69036.1 hypothetical protein ASG54_05120 [Aureimonas sp. Leaf460]KQT69271.1 hypothetical protein ASG62_17730 [Aureimonas sp. Leaf427]
MLIRLTYASLLAPHCDQACIDEIVAKSAPANQARGITGILAVDGDHVLQILEGPETVVLGLFEHIRRDDRHQGVVEIDRTSIEATHFEAWGMVKRSMADAVMMSESI